MSRRLNTVIAVFITVSVSLLSVNKVIAAQDSTVTEDNTPILTEPKKSAKTIEYLSIGSEVRVSNYPMPGGFYKVRASNGIYGWVQDKNLSLYRAPKKNENGELEESDIPKPERDRKWYLRALVGLSFFRPDDLNAIYQFNDLNSGTSGGGELGFMFSERVGLVARLEAMVKDVQAREALSGQQFNLGLRSYPAMFGFDFHLLRGPALRISAAVMGGLALGTSFASELIGGDIPNTVVLQRAPFTTLLRLNVTRPLGRVVSIFGEMGYRYLKTEEIDTSGAAGIAGGTATFGREGFFRARVIDLSGVTLGLGVGLHL